MTARKRPSAAFWATVVVVVALVGYPLSLFPIAWLDARGMLPHKSIRGKITWAYCAPARWAYNNGPTWISESLDLLLRAVHPED